jgi:hypothetical protein
LYLSEPLSKATDLLIFLWDTLYFRGQLLARSLKVMQLALEARDLFISFMQMLFSEPVLFVELVLRGTLFFELSDLTLMVTDGASEFVLPFLDF